MVGKEWRRKGDARWHGDIFLGRTTEGNEALVGTKDGVYTARCFRRRMESDRWSVAAVEHLKGLPCDTLTGVGRPKKIAEPTRDDGSKDKPKEKTEDDEKKGEPETKEEDNNNEQTKSEPPVAERHAEQSSPMDSGIATSSGENVHGEDAPRQPMGRRPYGRQHQSRCGPKACGLISAKGEEGAGHGLACP